MGGSTARGEPGTPTPACRDVRFRILGPVTAVDAAGRALSLGPPRGRALTAALLLRPGTAVSVDLLTGLLWASRVAPEATAFPHRADQYDLLILSQWADPQDSERNIGWTRRLFEAMRPHLHDAVYVNNLGVEGRDRVRAAYGANYARLAEVKRAYDPANVFRLNQNVDPRPQSTP